MNITAPSTATAGTTVCFQVSGAGGPVKGFGSIAGRRLKIRFTTLPDGQIEGCVTLPMGITGALALRIEDGANTATSSIFVKP